MKVMAIVTSLLNVYDTNYAIVILTDDRGFLNVNLVSCTDLRIKCMFENAYYLDS